MAQASLARRETLLQLIEVAHALPPAPALQLLRALRALTADPALLLPLYVRFASKTPLALIPQRISAMHWPSPPTPPCCSPLRAPRF